MKMAPSLSTVSCDAVPMLVQERHGMSFPYSGNVSFHSMNQSMDQEIRQKYTKKPTVVVIINWIMLVLAFWWTFFGFILWILMLCLTARPKKIAGVVPLWTRRSKSNSLPPPWRTGHFS